jgi:hypothetical protein
MKFGMGIVPVGTALKSYFFQFPTIGNNKMADEETRGEGSTQAPLVIGSYSDVW